MTPATLCELLVPKKGSLYFIKVPFVLNISKKLINGIKGFARM